MLYLQPAKREKGTFFDRYLRYDICRDTVVIGTLAFDPRRLQAAITVAGTDYTVARQVERPKDRVYHVLLRLLTGRPKPPANPLLLSTATGDRLASAEQRWSRFSISHEGRQFIFRRPSLFSRLYHLYPQDKEVALGTIGQDKFFTRQLQMALPESFAPVFQVFLVVLLLDVTMQSQRAGD